MGNALVVIDDCIESVNVKNRHQGARVSARRANREPEDVQADVKDGPGICRRRERHVKGSSL